jgi:glycosyltransferase involved in cell wall biosynthesis
MGKFKEKVQIKILIVTYYWPPSGGSGVQRWLKFVKFLSEYPHISLTVLTPENPELPEKDIELVKEIPSGIRQVKLKTREFFWIYKKLTGSTSVKAGFFKEKKSSLLDKIFIWLRGNFFIPDARRGWIKPASKWILNNYSSEKWNVIITTGPPHSVHCIGLHIKKNIKDIFWIADFRDPWTKIDYYHKLMLLPYADALQKKLEKKVLLLSDIIFCIGKKMTEDFAAIVPEIKKEKFYYIPNGFDPEDFKNVRVTDSNYYYITHTGTINADRNPPAFWKALRELMEENSEMKEKIRIRIVGRADIAVKENIRDEKLEERVEYIGYVSHPESINYLLQSRLLLLFINRTPFAEGILTGKIFEYIASRKPILCIGPPGGEADKILNETGSGKCIDFDDKEGIKNALIQFFNQPETIMGNNDAIQKYNRKNLTREVVQIIEKNLIKK